jgi:hypothetical protein
MTRRDLHKVEKMARQMLVLFAGRIATPNGPIATSNFDVHLAVET